MDFDQRLILVTGAGSGIGRATALALANANARLLLLGRHVPALESLFDDIIANGAPEPSILPLDLDGASAADYTQIAQAIEQQFGSLYALVHNAAELGERVPFEHYLEATWQRVMRVNFEAATHLTRALLPLLKASDHSHLVFTSSSVGETPRAYWGAYSVSKYALEGFAKLLAEEFEKTTQIDVTIINPGATRTRMRQLAYPAEDPLDSPEPEQVAQRYLRRLNPELGRQGAQRIHADGSVTAIS